jgi:hypothetical protein
MWSLVGFIMNFRVLYLREAYYPLKQLTIDFPRNAVGIATGYGLDAEKSEFDSCRDKIFLLFTSSRPVLEPTQPPIQRVSGALSAGAKRPGREATH